MSREIYANGTVVTRWDDASRTVTDYTADPPGVRDYTVEENAAADAAGADAARLDSIEARLARIEAHLWPAPPDPTSTARTWAEQAGVWPHGTLLDDGGIIWRNIAGAPLTEPPSRFPGGGAAFGHLFERVTSDTQSDEWPAWQQPTGAHDAYPLGAPVTHNGRHWTSNIAANPYAPGVYGWTDHGPA